MIPDSVFVPKLNALRIEIQFLQSEENAKVNDLVDTGATHNFMTRETAIFLNFQPKKLAKPRTIRNVDGTANKARQITEYVDIRLRPVQKKQELHCFYLADLGQDSMILGYPWIAANHTPINWEDLSNNPVLIANP
ncbi:hypothetical protein EDB87DRAFT_1565622 [Lactarius vividus]|nr:hypothetical protein EDB87DRAFT_1565622 [Lactarius vividus]